MAKELEKGMKKVSNNTNSKFAFSSFKDANFEYVKDKKDVEIINLLIQALINNRDEYSNYSILEREPQALIRLAHESLWKEKEPGDDLSPVEYLEYGLETSYQGPKKPMFYAIKLSGVDDSSAVVQENNQDDSNHDGQKASLTQVNQKKANIQKSHSINHNKKVM